MARSRRSPPEIPDVSAGSWNSVRAPVHRALKFLTKDLFESLPAPHQETHLVGGSDTLKTPGNPATLDPNLGSLVGAGPSYAREDHRHALDLKLTAKGDLLTRTASAYTRLPVGTDGNVLTADSTTPTGLAWKLGFAPTLTLVYNPHVLTVDYTLPAGQGAYIPRYFEIAAGVTFTIGADSDLEIG